MSRFTTSIEGYEAFVDFGWQGDKPTFSCREISDQNYPTLAALEKAIKDYGLKLRKDFKNTTAYRVSRGWGGKEEAINTVTVTSTDGKQAWIRNHKGDREKAERNGLYADKAEVQAAIAVEKECAKLIEGAWAKVRHWEPKP